VKINDKIIKIGSTDVNEAHCKMGFIDEKAVRLYLNYHGYKVTGDLRNCVSCMKSKAKTKPVNMIEINKATKRGEGFQIDLTQDINQTIYSG
jgi:hypothetical protein